MIKCTQPLSKESFPIKEDIAIYVENTVDLTKTQSSTISLIPMNNNNHRTKG